MPSAPLLAPLPSQRISFPRSSTRQQSAFAYCKLIEGIEPLPFSMCRFEGRIYRPGALIDLGALPRPAVVIECLGPLGTHQRGKHRDYGYILWSFDFASCEWREIARAQAPDASWTASLRESAWRALHPRPELVDIVQRSRDVTEELLAIIEQRMRAEMPEVKMNALYSIYERFLTRWEVRIFL